MSRLASGLKQMRYLSKFVKIMFNSFTTTAYDYLGNAKEHETSTDSWSHVELCQAMAEDYGYAETIMCGRHVGEYGQRPAALGQRVY